MPQIDDLKFKVTLLYNKMKRIHDAALDVERSPSDKKKQNLLSAAIANLDDQLAEFDEAISKLASIYSKQTPPVEEDLQEKFAQFETLYYNCRAISMTHLPESSNRLSRMSVNNSGMGEGQCNVGLALPKLKLPEFDGNILEWQSFHDLFLNTVHSADMNDVRKFTYLKSALGGEARALISNLPTTAANYRIAWESLNARYNDIDRLTNAYLETLFDMPAVSREACSLRNFASAIEQNLGALKALDHSTDSWATPLLFLFKRKLAPQLREKWEKYALELVLPATNKDFIRFLDNEVRVLEASKSISLATAKNSPKVNKAKPTQGLNSFVTSTTGEGMSCLCGKNQNLANCNKFRKMTVATRLKVVKARHLCLVCFSKHFLKNCPSKINCDHCDFPHHSMLCFKKANEVKSGSSKGNSSVDVNKQRSGPNQTTKVPLPGSSGDVKDNSVQSYQVSTATSSYVVMLATASAIAIGGSGVGRTVKILIDPASQASFIRSSVVESLGLKYTSYRAPIFGFGQTKAGVSRGLVEVNIKPRQSHMKFTVQALVVDHISQSPKLPTHSICWPHIQGLVLADPQFYIPQEIDVLLGAEWYAQLVSGTPILGPDGAPDLLETVFGYCLLGKVVCEEENPVHVMCTTCDFHLHRLIKAFWEVEEPPERKLLSRDEKACEDFFLKTVDRQEDGRFIVHLPFRHDRQELGDSYALARKRFHYLEKRLNKSPELRKNYNEFMADCIAQAHMVVAPRPPKENSYYVPHHCIFRDNETLSRFRIVFDFSMKTANGMSLNDMLYTGRKLQINICDVLMRFRFHECCLVADIRQMYRNIWISKSDYDYQRVFWRFSPNDPLLEYTLTTVMYGNAAAPYLALRVIAKLVDDEGEKFVNAKRVISENMFVDDICASIPTVSGALVLQQELVDLLGKGMFELRKWLSNRPEILGNVPDSHRAMNTDMFSFPDPEGINLGTAILGLAWNPVTDVFSFRIQPSVNTKTTKRIISSEIARLYDPLGFLSPVTLYGKLIMQLLWAQGTDWDEPPSVEVASKWEQFRNEIPLLSQFSVSRYVNLDSASDVQLHGFADASERAFAAVVYVRTVDRNGQIALSLLLAKSKVSPLKRESLPRLELCGAVLLSKLLDYARELLNGHCTINSITAWCDSMVALQWIKASPHKWKTYVANRVSYIHDRIPPSCFRHVPGDINPSDIASRGALPQQLLTNSYWRYGPDWLREPPSNWPRMPELLEGYTDVNNEAHIISLPTILPTQPMGDWIKAFSSYPQLRRVVAYWLRYFQYLRNPTTRNFPIVGPTTDELRLATIRLVYAAQQQVFIAEFKCLETGKDVPSKLRKLNPFIDSHSIIRVGGRLNKASTLSEDRKHPMLLPKDHHLTNIIIDHIHVAYFHAGPLHVHSVIQADFWILNAREVIRNRLSKCVKCFRAKPKKQEYIMGDLPAARVEAISAFYRSAVDYAGPVQITMGKIRNAKVFKSYICIFVCCSTKAIHLELVSDLTSEACIAALRRFIARRGTVKEIFSDCGTNFVGAKRKLADWLEVTGTRHYNERVARELGEKGIAWKLNAAGSPHMNGLAEAGVKTVKKHLIRVTGDQKFTFEEYYTLLTQIEGVVNSRPITPVSSDPNDLRALTPGHFLLQQPAHILNEGENRGIELSRRWKLLQQLLTSFWARWHKEYLGGLQMRAKWTKVRDNLKVNDLVLLNEHNLPPSRWKLARVINVYPGTDGTVRVAEVRTSQGVFTRTVRKLCPLPIN